MDAEVPWIGGPMSVSMPASKPLGYCANLAAPPPNLRSSLFGCLPVRNGRRSRQMDGMHVHEFFNESRDVRDALRMSQPVERMLILLDTMPSKPHVRIPYETLPAVAPSFVPESIVEADT